MPAVAGGKKESASLGNPSGVLRAWNGFLTSKGLSLAILLLIGIGIVSRPPVRASGSQRTLKKVPLAQTGRIIQAVTIGQPGTPASIKQ